MITGKVDQWLRPFVRLVVHGPDGRYQTVEAVMDSGFVGSLSLPSSVVRALGLNRRPARTQWTLADGRLFTSDVYEARVSWEGFQRPVRVVEAGNRPLLGMGLLEGYRLTIDVFDEGDVRIEPAE